MTPTSLGLLRVVIFRDTRESVAMLLKEKDDWKGIEGVNGLTDEGVKLLWPLLLVEVKLWDETE